MDARLVVLVDNSGDYFCRNSFFRGKKTLSLIYNGTFMVWENDFKNGYIDKELVLTWLFL